MPASPRAATTSRQSHRATSRSPTAASPPSAAVIRRPRAPRAPSPLRVARRLGERHPVDVRTTLLAAHALPPEYAGRADAYIDDVVVAQIIPEAAHLGLADAVDAFCETIGFTLAQTRRAFDAARAHG